MTSISASARRSFWPAKTAGDLVAIIPVYNHGATVAAVIRRTQALGLTVIVVDDGSTDDSHARAAAVNDITVLRHHRNQGKGAALLTGFRHAAKMAAWAVTLDADGQHLPEDVPALVRSVDLDRRPLVIGCRQGMHVTSVPWGSRIGGRFSNLWVRAAGGPRVRDSQSGFRLYPLPETLGLDVRSRRYQYEVEVLIKAHWQGLSVREAAVNAVYPSDTARVSHFHPLKDFGRNTQMFARLITRRVLRRRPPRASLR